MASRNYYESDASKYTPPLFTDGTTQITTGKLTPEDGGGGEPLSAPKTGDDNTIKLAILGAIIIVIVFFIK